MKKTSMPNPAKSLGYTKSYSSSSLRPVKSPSNSIRFNCRKICSWSRSPKTILEIRKKAAFLYGINNPNIYKFFKDFTNHKKKTNRAVVLSCRLFSNILKYWNHLWNFPNIWKTRLLQTLTEEYLSWTLFSGHFSSKQFSVSFARVISTGLIFWWTDISELISSRMTEYVIGTTVRSTYRWISCVALFWLLCVTTRFFWGIKRSRRRENLENLLLEPIS